MSTPYTSAGPDGPTQSSPIRSEGQFRTWFTNITDWIKALAPAGAPYSTGWITTANASRVVTLESNWEITSFACSREARDVDMQMRVVYNGPTVDVPSNGDLGNILIGTVASGFRPRLLASLSSSYDGPMVSASISAAGNLELAAVAPGVAVAAGKSFTFQGMWRLPSTDAT